MTLKEITLTENNHFVGMEYYNLILNRTFLLEAISPKHE